jgi:hypothetical protein
VVCRARWGFDRLSPNGQGFVFCALVFPIILSLSKGRLNQNDVGGAAKGKTTQEPITCTSLLIRPNVFEHRIQRRLARIKHTPTRDADQLLQVGLFGFTKQHHEHRHGAHIFGQLGVGGFE